MVRSIRLNVILLWMALTFAFRKMFKVTNRIV